MSIDNYKILNELCLSLLKIGDPYRGDYSVGMSFVKLKTNELELIISGDKAVNSRKEVSGGGGGSITFYG